MDLPSHLGTGFQSLDIGISAMKIALRSRDFQETPAIVAAVQSCINQLEKIVTAYTEGSSGSSSPSSTQPPASGSSSAESGAVDSDSQPAAGGGLGEAEGSGT